MEINTACVNRLIAPYTTSLESDLKMLKLTLSALLSDSITRPRTKAFFPLALSMRLGLCRDLWVYGHPCDGCTKRSDKCNPVYITISSDDDDDDSDDEEPPPPPRHDGSGGPQCDSPPPNKVPRLVETAGDSCGHSDHGSKRLPLSEAEMSRLRFDISEFFKKNKIHARVPDWLLKPSADMRISPSVITAPVTVNYNESAAAESSSDNGDNVTQTGSEAIDLTLQLAPPF